jgi:glutathione S-transferase
MRLHHHPFSSCSRRVRMTAHHLGLPLELELVDLGKGQQRDASYRQLNPNAKVPTLVDGDLVLWESHAIQLYLADQTPGQTLLPTDPKGRADVNRWLFWSANHFSPAIGVLNRENMIKQLLGGGPPDPVEVARGEQLFTDAARVLDAHLATREREWVAQDRLTLADFALAAPLMSTIPARLPVADFRHLQRWFNQVQELPAWQATIPTAPGAPPR